LIAIGILSVQSIAQSTASTDSSPASMLSYAKSTSTENVESTSGRSADSKDRLSQYVIGPADVIRINVWKNTDLSQAVTVDPNGFISLPLLGDIHVAGMTTDQLATKVSTLLMAYIVSPQVTVSVADIRSRQVYITGEIGKGGAYPLVAPITILQLIAEAGGLNAYAKRKDIYVLRTSNGQTEKLPFNYNKVTRGDGRDNILLQPGDTVIVP
jgi:polysaccharide biosynthesis/export protein